MYELPRLEQKHRPLLFTVRPGQMVWIPDGWLHMTVNIDDCIYAYKTGCRSGISEGHGPAARGSEVRHRAAIRRVCEKTGRFCDGYCHPYCTKCAGRECRC